MAQNPVSPSNSNDVTNQRVLARKLDDGTILRENDVVLKSGKVYPIKSIRLYSKIFLVFTIIFTLLISVSALSLIGAVICLVLFIKYHRISKKHSGFIDYLNNQGKNPETQDIITPVTKISVQSQKTDIVARISKNLDTFRVEYDSIPSYNIVVSGEKKKKQDISDLPAIRYTNITRTADPNDYKDFVSIDIETTGLSVHSNILEISAIRFRDFKPVEKFATFVNPEKSITEKITSINHITNDMVSGAPKIFELCEPLISFVGDDNIIGYNLDFDLSILLANNVDFYCRKRKYYDVLKLAKSRLKKAYMNYSTGSINDDREYDVENYQLATVCNYYQIIFPAHHAGCDALATGKLFKTLLYDN